MVGDRLIDRLERALHRSRLARIPGLRGYRFVRHEFGLQDDAHRVVDGLDLVLDRGDRSLSERHQARRSKSNLLAGWRNPLHVADQRSGPKVEYPLV